MRILYYWLVGTALADTASQSLNGSIQTGTVTSAADLANRLQSVLTLLAWPLAFAAVLYTAYILLTAGGTPDGWTKAKKNLVNVLIGFFLIFAANIFVSLLHSLLLSQ